MTDIARLGFDIDSSSLSSANTELRTLVSVAGQAERAINALGQTAQNAFTRVNTVTAGAVNATRNVAQTMTQAANQNVAAQQAVATAATNAASATAAAAQANVRASTAASTAARQAANDNQVLASSVSTVTRYYQILAATIAGGAIVKAADSFMQLKNAVALAGVSASENGKVMNALFAIADRNAQTIDSVTTLYRRAAISARTFGASNDDIEKSVIAATSALKIQGTSANEARGALLQLGQSFGTGRLRMQEFNSVTENLQPLAQAAAKAILGETATVAQLRQAIQDGTVSSQQWFNAIKKAADELQSTADKIDTTIGGAVNRVYNGFVKLIGISSDVTGAGQGLVSVLSGLGSALSDAATWVEKNRDALPQLAENLTTVATVITTALIPAFIELGVAGAAAITRITIAMARNPFGLLLVAISTVLVAIYQFRDNISDIFGVDIQQIAKDAGNFIIRAFISAYEQAKFVWQNFGDIISNAFAGAVNVVVDGINFLLKKSTEAVNDLIALVNSALEGMNSLLEKIPGAKARFGTVSPLNAPQIEGMTNPNRDVRLGAAEDELNQRLADIANKDYVGKIGDAFRGAKKEAVEFNTAASNVADTLNGKHAKALQKIIQSAQDYVEKERVKIRTLGQDIETSQSALHTQELINRALEAGIVVTEPLRKKFEELGAAMGKVDAQYSAAKFVNDFEKQSQLTIGALQAETEALFMSTEAGTAYRLEKERLNAAIAAGIPLKDLDTNKIKENAAAVAKQTVETNRLKDIIEFSRDTWKGFWSDMREGLIAGQTLWQSFGNAALNVLNKISEKFLELAASSVWDNFLGPIAKSVLGGLLGGATGGITAISPSSPYNVTLGASGLPVFSKDGNIFHAGNVIAFKNGGIPTLSDFSNQILSRPTMFAMGMAGEAGDEAVVPLRRGHNGRLGIEAFGQPQRGIVEIHLIDDMLDARIASGANIQIVKASPGIESRAVKKSGKEVPARMAQHQQERLGEWRVG